MQSRLNNNQKKILDEKYKIESQEKDKQLKFARKLEVITNINHTSNQIKGIKDELQYYQMDLNRKNTINETVIDLQEMTKIREQMMSMGAIG